MHSATSPAVQERQTTSAKGATAEPTTTTTPTISSIIQLLNEVKLESYPTCQMVNVVSTYSLGVRLNLQAIALMYKHVMPIVFNPDRFAAAALSVKTKNLPPTKVLLFSSGNVVHTGAKTEEHSRTSGWALAYFFNKFLGIPATLIDFRIRNIVGHFSLGYAVDLDGLSTKLGARATFEPERIQSCRIRSKDDVKLVALVYFTGSAVVTGAKTRDDMIKNYKETVDTCKDHVGRGDMSKLEYRYSMKRKNVDSKKIKKVDRRLAQMERMGRSNNSNTNNATARGDEIMDLLEWATELDDTKGNNSSSSNAIVKKNVKSEPAAPPVPYKRPIDPFSLLSGANIIVPFNPSKRIKLS
jgi:transcription initiation factor TFIID TATA-box-binding protein